VQVSRHPGRASGAPSRRIEEQSRCWRSGRHGDVAIASGQVPSCRIVHRSAAAFGGFVRKTDCLPLLVATAVGTSLANRWGWTGMTFTNRKALTFPRLSQLFTDEEIVRRPRINFGKTNWLRLAPFVAPE